MVGIKSSARAFGERVKLGVSLAYIASFILVTAAIISATHAPEGWLYIGLSVPFGVYLAWQIQKFQPDDGTSALKQFKASIWGAVVLLVCLTVHIYNSQ